MKRSVASHARTAAALVTLASLRASAQTSLAIPAVGDPRTIALQPQLAAQLRFTGQAGDANSTVAPLLELRRIRPRITITALQSRLTATLVLNTTPSSLELLDCWVEGLVRRDVRLRVGLTKTPFTTYRLQTFSELLFVDWALVTRVFGNERQLGLEVHNRGSTAALEYSLGVFNGTTMRTAHGVGLAGDYGEALRNLSDLRAYNPPDTPHPELVARAVFHHGRRHTYAFSPTTPSAPSTRAPGFGLDVGASASVDLHPTIARDFSHALAPELALRLGPLSLAATGYLGLARLTQRAGLALVGGVLVESSVSIARRVAVALRFARVDRDEALLVDARARADALVAAASGEQQASLRTQLRDAGALRSEQELTLGVTVSILGPTLVAQTDVSWLETQRTDGAREALRYRVQLQCVF